MRRRAKFSWEAHWREAYATGEIDLARFEQMIEWALRAERAPKQERTKVRAPKLAAQNWRTGVSAHAANYTQALQSGTFNRPSKESSTF